MVTGNSKVLAKIGAIGVEARKGGRCERASAAHAVTNSNTIFGTQSQSADAGLDLIGRGRQTALDCIVVHTGSISGARQVCSRYEFKQT